MTAKTSMSRIVAILAMPGVQLLDVSGPLDVFAEANVQASRNLYRLQVIGGAPGEIRSSSGTRLVADRYVGGAAGEAIDTLLVAGCPNLGAARSPDAVIAWLREVAPQTRRYGSVCTGAFLLAEAGLLDGKRITTHWAVADRLAAAYPAIIVDADAIHVCDGKLRTAAGVTAGLDLALALIEEDLGRDIAIRVARQLVMFFKRPGGQMQLMQFSAKGEAVPAARSVLQEILRFVAANPGADHSVGSLAKRANLSPRHFARLFHGEIGVTPAAWIETARVSAARRLLEMGREAPKQVAVRCGFGNADVLRRAFARHVGITPAEYRRRFATG